MDVILVTPAKKRSRGGNRTTAVRWARILEKIGHNVRVQTTWDGSPADMMLALHAWRSAESIDRFRVEFPRHHLVVVLTGTDIYRFQDSHPEITKHSMEQADLLICLHDLVHEAIPKRFGRKLHVIHQSAIPLSRPRIPARKNFDICVIGHLREEKDSLRTAYAVRDLPETSRLRVIHLGKAHDETWAVDASREAAQNPRYTWLGDVPGWRVRREFVKTHLMVLSSVMEGGANVISEAVVAGVPIIASKIHGSVGLLGNDFPGYYPPKDTSALRALLLRAEQDPEYVTSLATHGAAQAHLFTEAREEREWHAALEALGSLT